MHAGIWRHYKGPLYLVLGTAHDANADSLYDENAVANIAEQATSGTDPLEEREVVVYVPLQLDGAHLGPRMAVRTRSDFEANCCIKKECPNYGQASIDGFPRECVNGGHLWPRFVPMGEHLTQEMLP